MCNKLAETEFEDLNILLDMLFSKDHTNMQSVTRQMLSDFIISDMNVPVHIKDIELFIKTHEILCSRELYSRSELKSIFDRPFREARDRMVLNEATAGPRRTGYGYQDLTKARQYQDSFK